MKSYIYRGKKIFVTALMGKEGAYGTVWASSYGGTHRLRFKSLPVRDTREEAQHDLDEFARVRKLKEAE